MNIRRAWVGLAIATMTVVGGCADNERASLSSTPEASADTGREPTTQQTQRRKRLRVFRRSVPKGFAMPQDATGRRLLSEYGAVLVAKGGVAVPPRLVFDDEAGVAAWQAGVETSVGEIGGVVVELQTPAMTALVRAISDAEQRGLTISPRGADAAKRSYTDTLELWSSRVVPGLKHWVDEGRLAESRAWEIAALPSREQVTAVLELESKGMFFARTWDKSILYSVAPPGTSQHLWMLALDIAESDDAELRQVLADRGWFQVVVSDEPHFTYLGVEQSELGSLGLKPVAVEDRTYWVPDV